jgi:hypothetical protein
MGFFVKAADFSAAPETATVMIDYRSYLRARKHCKSSDLSAERRLKWRDQSSKSL